jgi:cytochrome c oxidase subunit 3
MEIPYTIEARPDTGLWNAKLGIWLFLASEVMLFGGLFSGYVFLRLGALPGYWPHGLLYVPVGTANTAILIASSVTVVFAWAFLKIRNFTMYRVCMAATIICGTIFLIVKLSYEWPAKFHHFGAFIKPEVTEKYEPYLGNKRLLEKGMAPRYEISGHLHAVEIDVSKAQQSDVDAFLNAHGLKSETEGKKMTIEGPTPSQSITPFEATDISEIKGVQMVSFKVALDPVNADPDNAENDRPHFWPRDATDTMATIEAADIDGGSTAWSAFIPRHSSYFAIYFLITGLHGLHVLGGLIVFVYYMLPVSTRLYRKDPEHFANRVEVAGLFWHFVDLVWIFVFPIFYLL